MTWLSGWGKRRKLTLDSFRVDEDLTDFPISITLISGTGKNNADVTSVFDELIDIGAIYNEWNSADKHANISLFNYYLTAESVNVTTWKAVRSVVSRSSGKWYWEVKIDAGSNSNFMVGIGTASETLTYPGDTYQGYGYGGGSGYKYHSYYDNYGAAYTVNDIVSVALDLDNGKIWWAKNGVWQDSGNPATGANPAWTGVVGNFFAMVGLYTTGNKATANFGASSFTYSAPSGFTSGFGSIGDASDGKKMMLTTSDGVTPCYVEIERWDPNAEKAYLWAKIPTIVSGTDTILYLYYDKTQNDNDHYIGDTGEEAALNVWDDNFVGVWHMAQDPSGDDVKDSTYNANHGTPAGGMTSDDLVDGKIGKAIGLDGFDDYISLDTVTVSDWTVEVTSMPLEHTSGDGFVIFNGAGIVEADGYWVTLAASDAVKKGNTMSNDTFVTITATKFGSTYNMYENGIENSTDHSNAGWSLSGVYRIGSGYLAGKPKALVDEVRISSMPRNVAWIKATYYSNWNNFITFGAEENEPVYYWDGFVKEHNQPVSRAVKLYRRDTGTLVDSSTSRYSDGYYYLTSSSSGTHFIVAFDDDVGDEFNALIIDKISPKGTV